MGKPKNRLRCMTFKRGKKKAKRKRFSGRQASSSKCCPGVNSISSLFKSCAGLVRIAKEEILLLAVCEKLLSCGAVVGMNRTRSREKKPWDREVCKML